MNHKGTVNLMTERLLLRRFVREDAMPMYKTWANDSEVTRFLSWLPHENVEVTKNVLRMWVEDYDSNEHYSWGIVLKESGKLIGSIAAMNHMDEHCRCEVGYCIGRDYWGKGIMTEALRAVIEFLILEVGYNRIQAYHHTANKASGKVMVKAGMKFESLLREYIKNSQGSFTDCDMYSILASDIN